MGMSSSNLPALPDVSIRAEGNGRKASRKLGEKTLIATYVSARLDPVAQQLLERFPPSAEQGFRLRLGWSEVTARGDQELTLFEPNFEGGWTEGIENSLEIAAAQALFHQENGIPTESCSHRDRVLLADGILQRERLVMHRHSPARHGNSGWYIGPVDPADIQELTESAPAPQQCTVPASTGSFITSDPTGRLWGSVRRGPDLGDFGALREYQALALRQRLGKTNGEPYP